MECGSYAPIISTFRDESVGWGMVQVLEIQ